MSRRLLEAGKTLLIILLCVSALFLAGKTELFNNIKDSVPLFITVNTWIKSLSGSSEDSKEGVVAFKEASVPLYAAVTSLGGQHCGLKYDGKVLKYFYERTGSILGKALSSASAPEAITEEAWRKALQSPGIFYDYENPVPLETLSGWFGANPKNFVSGASVRRLCIASPEKSGVVALYYCDENNNKYYRSYTAVLYSTLSTYTVEYLPNGAKYAFELTESDNIYAAVSPYTLLLKSFSGVSDVTVANPFYSLISKSKILEIFKVNLRLSEQYPESDNTDVYLEERYSLRLRSSGTVSYHSSRSPGNRMNVISTGSSPTFSEMLESARALTASTVGSVCGDTASTVRSVCGDAEVLYTGYSEENGDYKFTFDYYVNGIAVHLPSNRHAATIEISGNYIVSADFVFRTFTLGSGLQKPLPELQAAVLVRKNGEPVLGYFDKGKGGLEAEWAEK